MNRFFHIVFAGWLLLLVCSGCTCSGPRPLADGTRSGERFFTNPILPDGSSPCLVSARGKFYYLQSSYTRIGIRCAERIDGLKTAQEHIVYQPGEKYYISAPQMVSLNGKWYIYYSCEGRDMTSRHINVLENTSEDPLEGEFVHKAVLQTRDEKAVHPYAFVYRGRLYLLWSGFDKSGSEPIYARIYIAEMKSPWELSQRSNAILVPQYEWECQWYSENYYASTGPVYVNEGPVVLPSRDSSKLLLYYAASQTYTPYYCEGLAWADADADLMDSRSWNKLSEPVFQSDETAPAFGAGHLNFFQDAEDRLYILYQAYSSHTLNRKEDRSPRMQEVVWGADGIPVLGRPIPLSQAVREPVPIP